MARDYGNAQFPIRVSHWKQGLAMGFITPYWGQIPVPLERKIADAFNGNHELVLTKDDLDSLPDALWAKLEPYKDRLFG